MNKLWPFLVFACLSGCAVQQKTQSATELKKSVQENLIASTRFYNGIAPSQIQDASMKVLGLVDKPDMRFDIQGNDLLATRFSTYYAVFSFGFGRDWYSVNINQDKSGSYVRFAAYGELLSGFPSPIPESYRSNIPIGAHDNPANATLFHDRLEYMLGIRSEWATCEQAKNRQVNKSMKLSLCDSLGIEDESPVKILQSKLDK